MVELSKFDSTFDIVSTDLRHILSIFVATYDYALFKKSVKIATYIFKRRGGREWLR